MFVDAAISLASRAVTSLVGPGAVVQTPVGAPRAAQPPAQIAGPRDNNTLDPAIGGIAPADAGRAWARRVDVAVQVALRSRDRSRSPRRTLDAELEGARAKREFERESAREWEDAELARELFKDNGLSCIDIRSLPPATEVRAPARSPSKCSGKLYLSPEALGRWLPAWSFEGVSSADTKRCATRRR